MKKIYFLLFTVSFYLTACNFDSNKQDHSDYEQNKKMIIDILKSDDGKKKIQEIFSDDKTKEKLILDDVIVKETIEKTLQSKKGRDFWKKGFEDPKFIQALAKGMKEEHKKILKELMKDPDYQVMVVNLFKDPDVEKQLIQLLKNKDFNKHIQTAITESIDTPLFQAKLEQAFLKSIESMNEKKEDKEDKEDAEKGEKQDSERN